MKPRVQAASGSQAGPSTVFSTVLSMVLLLALLVVATVPPVAAQASPFLGARTTVDARIDLDDLVFDTDVRAAVGDLAGAGGVGGCGDPGTDVVPEGFVFSESADETGCAQATLRLPVPAGATRAVVTFAATREVEQTINPNFPIDFVQTFRFLDADGNATSEVPVFAAGAPAHPAPQNTTASTDLAGADELVVAWLFNDRAELDNQLVANPSRGQAFTSRTSDVAVRFEGLPTVTDWSLADRTVRPGAVDAAYRLTVDVPAGLFDAGRPHVDFVLADRLKVDSLRTPDGARFQDDVVDVRTDGDATVYSLPADLVAAHGPGAYVLTLGSVEPVSPSASLLPAALLVLFVPAGAGAYGYGQERRLRTVVGKTGLRSALVNYRFAIIAVTILYAALLAIVFFSGHVWNLVVPPLGLTAAVYISAFLLVALLFVVVATYGFQRQTALAETEVETLQRARRDLERSNKDLEHFAYIASHDLQEPLRTISGFSQLLERRYGDKLDDQGRRYIRKTVQGSMRMQTLIGDLLAYSRVSTGAARNEPVDVGALIDEEAADLKAILKETGGRVERSALPTIPADRSQLRQVFGNLVLNAIKYRHPDRPPRVHVDAVLEGRHWHFRVRDNGKGIPKDQYERIFVIFQRLEQKYDGEGTGLGLAIVQKVVERHGGRIWVESQVGVGTTFHLLLPANDPGDHP